jgi:hypothetical protein
VQVGLSGNLSLSWDAAANAASYTIARATSLDGPYSTIASGITTTSYSDTGLTNGSTYYYTVTSVNASGQGIDSPGNSGTPTDQYDRLKFEETTGTTASDSTGHSFDGTLTNGPAWTISGKLGHAVSLDGSNDYIALPTGVVNGLTTATIAAWVNLTSVSSWMRIFDFGTGTTNYMFLAPKSNSGLRFAIMTPSSGGEQQITWSSSLSTNTWAHVAVVLNGGTGTLYVNGVQVAQNTAMTLTPSSLGATNLNYIGKSQFGSDPYLPGRVDDFRIYSRALSGSEITTLASATIPAAPVGLIATAGDQKTSLKWNTSAAASSYIVKRSTTSGGPYQIVATNVTATSYTDTGLTDGVTYYYVVAAANLVDPSGNSAQSSATPAALPGDADHSGAIDTADFILLGQNFNATGAAWEQGDFTADGIVNALDFNVLASNFGRTFLAAAVLSAPAATSATVPISLFSATPLAGSSELENLLDGLSPQ